MADGFLQREKAAVNAAASFESGTSGTDRLFLFHGSERDGVVLLRLERQRMQRLQFAY